MNSMFANKIRMAACLIAALVLIIGGGSANAQTQQDTFDRLFDQAAAGQPRFAIAAAFAYGDQDPYVRTAGTQSITSDVVVGPDQPWHIGSITKSFTATLIMQLSERGAVDLDTAIGGYLGPYTANMHEDWQALTLRQLLSHTAGIPANSSVLSLMRRSNGDTAQGRVAELRRLWGAPIGAHDGSYTYSNIGYVLAGLVAEQVTGKSWWALVQDEIAAPLGLETLGIGPPVGPNAPWGHSRMLGLRTPMDPTNANSDNPAWMAPAGLLHLSVSDLVRWGQVHQRACAGLQPDFLSRQSCMQMRTPGEGRYGLGWIVQPVTDTNATLVWHNGSNTKWYAILVMVPERDLVMAITLNKFDEPVVDTLLRALIDAFVN